jgi:hypothetical protein
MSPCNSQSLTSLVELQYSVWGCLVDWEVQSPIGVSTSEWARALLAAVWLICARRLSSAATSASVTASGGCEHATVASRLVAA